MVGFLAAEKERISKKHPWTSLQCLWKCYSWQKQCWLLDKSDGLWNRKSKAPWFVSLRPFKPLVLKCCNVLVPLFAKINESQHNNRHSLYQTAKKALSHFMQHLWHSNMCTRCIPHSLTVQHKTKKQATSFKLLVHFDAGERPSYPGQLKQIKPGSIILQKRQKGKPWYGTILHLPGRNNSRSLCQQASWSLPSGTAKEWFL